MGERTPLALLDAPASGRMAVGEALTNIAAADIGDTRRRQAVGQLDGGGRPSRRGRARCSTRCSAVGVELCPALGIAIPVGKDSLSMSTAWDDGGEHEAGRCAAVADRHRLRAGRRRAPHADAAAAARRDGRNRAAADRPRRRQEPPRRLGAGAGLRRQSASARPTSMPGAAPGLLRRDPGAAPRRPAARLPRPLRRRPVRDGLRDGLCRALRRLADDRHRLLRPADERRRRPRPPAGSLKGRFSDRIFGGLFNEELGAVVQVRRDDRDARDRQALRDAGLGACTACRSASRTRTTRSASGATPSWSMALHEALDCSAPGARPATACALRDDPDAREQEFDALARCATIRACRRS